ncbi:MAG: tetratricopeptide repeat protein [Gemmatimonadales bacterium]
MATTVEPTPMTASGDSNDTPFFTPQRIRQFGIAGAVVLVIALVAWFAITAGKRKEAFAARELEVGRSMAEQGNLGGAVEQFNKVSKSYSGTSAAYDATLGIAQARLVNGQHELAIGSLQEFIKSNPPANYASPANSLLGTAYENTGKFVEAAAAYRKAADLSTLDYLKATALLDQGRALRLAGKKDEAIAVYKEILTKFAETSSKTEAQVRLSELTLGQS